METKATFHFCSSRSGLMSLKTSNNIMENGFMQNISTANVLTESLYYFQHYYI